MICERDATSRDVGFCKTSYGSNALNQDLQYLSGTFLEQHYTMATMLASVGAREVVRCDLCLLVQFPSANNNCRRCHRPLDEPEPTPAIVPVPAPVFSSPRAQVALQIKTLRLERGLSQRQLAARMSVPRTYVSKIENEKATPTLSSLERLARALEVMVPELLSGGERTHQEEVYELVKDQFVAELLPFVSQLNRMQMSSILSQVQYRSRSRAAAAA